MTRLCFGCRNSAITRVQCTYWGLAGVPPQQEFINIKNGAGGGERGFMMDGEGDVPFHSVGLRWEWTASSKAMGSFSNQSAVS